MQRRQFLAGISGLAGLAGLGLSGAARADTRTYADFHAALARDPSLAVYADVRGELRGSARIVGRLPRDLQGSFYRNGPGRFERAGERFEHLFDGDGFAQRWQIGAGTVQHHGRFVETQRVREESQAGQFLYPAFGTLLDRRSARTNDQVNSANTNLLPFNGQLYALWEGGSATELDPDTLATRGTKTWRPDLAAMPFSAHPKADPDGGLWNFGILPGADKLALYRLGPSGQVLRSALLDVPQLNFVHDFVVSARHLIFLVPPYDFSTDSKLALAARYVWAGSGAAARPLRALVVAKDTLTVRQIFELPPHLAYHLGNAWEDGACTRLDATLRPGAALHQLSALMHGQRPSLDGSDCAVLQICLDYASGIASTERLFGAAEFPCVMPQVVSTRHRRLAVISSDRSNPTLVYDTVNLLDTENGKHDSYRFDPGWQVEEHILVPRRHARSETDGYLLGVAQDTRAGVSVLTVFDAARISAGPVALAHLPYRTALCFHGNFLAI